MNGPNNQEWSKTGDEGEAWSEWSGLPLPARMEDIDAPVYDRTLTWEKPETLGRISISLYFLSLV